MSVGHSHLGASGASRWMTCSGSVTLHHELEQAGAEDFSDASFRVPGTAAHEVAALCLKTGTDAWEHGDKFYDEDGMIDRDGAVTLTPVSDLDLTAVQEYVDQCRAIRAEALEAETGGYREFIEHPVGEYEAYRPHPDFYGTVDYAMLTDVWLKMRDMKFGEGIAVNPKRNPQMMYYAFGILLDIMRTRDIDRDFPVELGIVQPRMWSEEPEKPWKTTAGEILDWGKEELLPKMKEANEETKFVAGEHCRFCPAKIACPLLKGMFRVAMSINHDWLKVTDHTALAMEWKMIGPVKMYIKAIEQEVMGNLMLGRDVGEGDTALKLVNKKAERIFKPEGIEVIKKKLGALAFTEPELKSPAQIEKIDADAKKLVKEWAYTPDTGFTVALASDKKPGVKVATPEETFAHIVSGRKGEKP